MDEKAKFEKKMFNVKANLISLFGKAIELAYPECEGLPTLVQASQNDKFGDYQCNSAMAISKVWCFDLDIHSFDLTENSN